MTESYRFTTDNDLGLNIANNFHATLTCCIYKLENLKSGFKFLLSISSVHLFDAKGSKTTVGSFSRMALFS